MADSVSLLLKILNVEFEEVENDVLSLLEYTNERFRKHEITNYVWLENQALLKKEISCVKELRKDILKWNPPENLPIAEIVQQLGDYLKNIVRERDYPGLVNLVVERKLEKVIKYLE